MTTPIRIRQRTDTSAAWTASNPVLADGELGIERNTRFFKFGDGVTTWNALPYVSTTGGVSGGAVTSVNGQGGAVVLDAQDVGAVPEGDVRVTADQAATVASIRTLGPGAEQAAAGSHTHTATQITDGTNIGRSVLTAATTAAGRNALEVVDQGTLEGIVYWNATTGWGATRPTGYKRIRFAANGAINSTDPQATIALAGDVWERPA